MFPGEELKNFRELITQSGKKQDGKSLAKISESGLSNVIDVISLTDDQRALVDLTVNIINSNNVYEVEYYSPEKLISRTSFNLLMKRLNGILKLEYSWEANSTIVQTLESICGEAFTTPTLNGSLTLIKKNIDTFNTNRPATLGHEIMGHGHSFQFQDTDNYNEVQFQHVLPIQIENLILRNMGITKYRDGTDHGPKSFIPNYNSLPKF